MTSRVSKRTRHRHHSWRSQPLCRWSPVRGRAAEARRRRRSRRRGWRSPRWRRWRSPRRRWRRGDAAWWGRRRWLQPQPSRKRPEAIPSSVAWRWPGGGRPGGPAARRRSSAVAREPVPAVGNARASTTALAGRRIGNRPGIDNRTGGIGNRPGIDNRPGGAGGIGNRPGIDNRPGGIGGIGNRPGIDNRPAGSAASAIARASTTAPAGSAASATARASTTDPAGSAASATARASTTARWRIGNRPGIDNRPIVGSGNTINRGDVNVGGIRQNNLAGIGVDPGYGVRPPAYNNWRGAYWGYHQGWANGYWHGYHNNNYWGWGSFGLGAAAGVTAWALGSSFYNWGYASYANPYYAQAAMAQPIVIEQTVAGGEPQTVTVPGYSYDYSQPIDTQSTPPPAEVADPAIAKFDSARAALATGTTPALSGSPTRRSRYFRTTPPSTSSGHWFFSRSGSTNSPRGRSTPCSRSDLDGTGRPWWASTRTSRSTPLNSASWRHSSTPIQHRLPRASSWPITT